MDDIVLLRDVTEADLEVLLEQEHDPEAVRRSRFRPREREAFMHHWKTRVLGDPTVFVQAVMVEGELAGNLVAWWEGDRRFIGYWFGRAFWGARHRHPRAGALPGQGADAAAVRGSVPRQHRVGAAAGEARVRAGGDGAARRGRARPAGAPPAAGLEMSVPASKVRRMDETSENRQAAHAYVDTAERRDWEAFAALLAEDVVYEMPQTRERIRGKQLFLRFNMEYPGDWHLKVRRIVADGRHAAAWLDTRVGDERQDACVWFEFSDDGLIRRVTDFWPEPYDPPAGREHLVERW
ncbi:nuclear transport factor 2 family protein [Nonomuraea rubra]